MQIHLSPRHLTLTASIHRHVADKIEHLESISDDIIAAHVVLLHDESKNTKKFQVKAHLAVPGPDIHAADANADLHVAIDKTADKLARQLRKRKTKLNSARKHRAQMDAEGKKRGYKRA